MVLPSFWRSTFSAWTFLLLGNLARHQGYRGCRANRLTAELWLATFLSASTVRRKVDLQPPFRCGSEGDIASLFNEGQAA